MTRRRTDEEKIQLVIDLIKRGYDEAERLMDEAIWSGWEKVEKEGDAKKDDTPKD